MGRCYEFGAAIHAGCERAMIVTAEGGACECDVCGTLCPGRFSGCAEVVAIPRRVPPSAPAWSVPGAEEEDPAHELEQVRVSLSTPEASRTTAASGLGLSPAADAAARLAPPAPAPNGRRAPTPSDLAQVEAGLNEVRELLVRLVERSTSGAVDTRPVLEAAEAVTAKLVAQEERLEALGRRQSEMVAQVEKLNFIVHRVGSMVDEMRRRPVPQLLGQLLARRP